MCALACALGLALDVMALPAPVPPPPGSTAWVTLKVVDGVTLRRAPAADWPRAPWGMGETEIAAPVEAVIAHLLDFEGLVHHLPRLERLRVLARAADQALVYFRFDLPWPISDRDWTVRYRFARDGAGGFRMVWSDDNSSGPPPAGAVRVSPVRGAWELSPTGPGTTRVRYLFLAELGGRMPRRVVEETSWKQPLYTLLGVKKALGSR
jgi:hypothetical protein